MRASGDGGGASDEGPASFLFVTQYYPPELGAAQVRIGSVTRHLAGRGHRVEVVTAIPNYPLGRLFPGWSHRPVQVSIEDGIRVVRVWVFASVGSGLARIANYVSFGLLSVIGVAAAKPADWTVVEYPTLAGALPAVAWSRLRRRRVIVNVADLWVDAAVAVGAIPDGAIARAAARAERWMLARADLVNAVTEGVHDALLAKGVAPSRLRWLPNGADTDLFSPGAVAPGVREELGAGPDEAVVLYAGTHGYVHGLDVVLDAASALGGEPIRFVLVGGGSEKEALRARAAAERLTNVTFLDPVPPERVADYLRVADVGLATVRRGDLYRSIRSAKMLPVMASATPIVYAGDDEGAAIVRREGAGIVCPPGDGPALADAVRALVHDPAAAAELGAAGRAWVCREASWEAIADRWLADLAHGSAPSSGSHDDPLRRLLFVGVHAGARRDQAPGQDEILAARFARAGVEVRTASTARSPAIRTLDQAWAVVRSGGWADATFVTVFSGRSFVYADVVSRLARLRGTPIVMVLHGGRLPDFAREHPRWTDAVLARADLLVAPSPFLARAFADRGHDVRCIPNLVEQAGDPPSPRTAARPRLLWMRTFAAEYDPVLAVDVLEIVRRTNPEVTLTMAGADHGALPAVLERARVLGLGDAIDHVGFLDEGAKREAFATHDVFLNTNRIDNTPVSVIEAAGQGLVPVSTDAGGIPDLLTDGVDACLVPVGDATAMARAVTGLLAEPRRFAALSRAALDLGRASDGPTVERRWREELAVVLGARRRPR